MEKLLLFGENEGKYNNWRGCAFETLCIQHVDDIKRALGMINDDFNYKKVSGTMINRIEQQTGSEVSQMLIDSDLFQEDVNLIAKNGKLYYLPIAE